MHGRILGIYVIEDNSEIPQYCFVSEIQMVAKRRKAMIDITKNGVNFALLEGHLLSAEIDRKTFHERTSQLAMRPFVKREILPGDVKGEALDNLIRDGALSMHHVTGTAKMGKDELSVVEANLRVYGVNHLRIADGSIMPTITTGNTQAPCVIIGERMAEILKLT